MNGSWKMPAAAYTFTAHHAAGEHELAARLLGSLSPEELPDLIRCLAMQIRIQCSIWPSPAARTAVAAGAPCGCPECIVIVDILAGRPVAMQLTPEELATVANGLAYVSCDSAAAGGVDGPAHAAMLRRTSSVVYQIAENAQ